MGEYVTWEATHFGIRQTLTSTITALKSPVHFRDEQLKGLFKFIHHDHYFEQLPEGVMMKDVFQFQSPFGWLGKLVDRYILTKYLTGFLLHRNNLIKEYAENTKLAAQILL